MDSPGYVRPAGNGPKGETGTAVKYLKTESLKNYFCGHLHLAFGYTDQRTVPFC